SARGSRDRTVRLWKGATGTQIGTALQDEGEITDVAINKDGTILASIREDGRVTLRNLRNLTSRETFLPGPSRPDANSWTLAFSPTDSTLLAVAGDDETGPIVLWNTTTRKPMRNLTADAPVLSMAFSHDGKTIVAGDQNGSVKAWDIALPGDRSAKKTPGNRFAKGFRHFHSVFGIAFSPNDRRVASVGLDRSVYIHDLDHPDREPRRLNGYAKPFLSVDFIDNDTLATGADNGAVVIWDLSGDYPFQRSILSVGISSSGADFAADGKTLISHWNNQLQFRPLAKPFAPPQIISTPDSLPIRLSLRSPDGEYLVTVYRDPNNHRDSIVLWDVASRSQTRVLVPAQSAYIVQAVAFSPDNQTLAVSLGNREDVAKGQVWLLDIAGGDRTVLSDVFVYALAFSADGGLLAGAKNGSVSVWD